MGNSRLSRTDLVEKAKPSRVAQQYLEVVSNRIAREKKELEEEMNRNNLELVKEAVTIENTVSKETFKIKETYKDIIASFYCACSICNGKYAGKVKSGKTISNTMEDPRYVAIPWLPQGTKVEISLYPGVIYTTEDTGNHPRLQEKGIDIFVPKPHKTVYEMGLKEVELNVIE